MSDFGENPIESMLRPVVGYANESHSTLGKVGIGLLAVGLFVASEPLMLAGAGVAVGMQIYKRVHAPTLNRYLEEASKETED